MRDDAFDNVRQFGPKPLRARAKEMLGHFVNASELTATLERPYLVKGWLEGGAVSVVYGPSNVGKSFLALDLANHVSKGRQWGGNRVSKTNCLYIGAEGGAGLSNRIAAMGDADFWVYPGTLTLGANMEDARAVSDVIEHLEGMHGAFGLVIIDTLARTFGGADENSAKDMGGFINAVDHIRDRTGAHIMVIHHTGKAAANGSRGSYALPAGVDVAIELAEQDDGIIHAEVKKQRDGKKGTIFAYRLREVELGLDQDGDPVTTCLVEQCAPAANTSKAGVASGQAALAMIALGEALAEGGRVMTGAGFPAAPVVAVPTWRKHCDAVPLTPSDKPAARTNAFKRAVELMQKTGKVRILDGFAWPISDES